MQSPRRPLGVTLLAILSLLGGLASLVIAVLSIGAFRLAADLLLANGIVDLALSFGYITGKSWAWILGIVLGIINIVGSIIEIALNLPSTSLLGIIFSGITLIYLTRQHVKSYFGRGPIQLPIGGSAQVSSSTSRACRNCGQALPTGTSFCHNCGTIQ